jgi:putative sugar O-methyltransferase
MNSRIQEMLDELGLANELVRPSKFWEELNERNIQQLDDEGYENFKRTVARNYFTWVSGLSDLVISSQLRFLISNTAKWRVARAILGSVAFKPYQGLSWKRSVVYNALSLLIWEYAKQVNIKRYPVRNLSEPLEGNPFSVRYLGQRVSQDLGNSFLEYQAIMDSVGVPSSVNSVMELGSGYGRTGYMFLALNPSIRYVCVDIPPALYVCERYLSSQFADRRIFRFRAFRSYAEIAEEYEQAQIAFLLPHQLEMLPPESVDLFINISSLHEMTPEQIKYYIDHVDRLTKGYFYMKQWKSWHNALDGVSVGQEYPIPSRWRRIYWRDCRVQTLFFEALLSTR